MRSRWRGGAHYSGGVDPELALLAVPAVLIIVAVSAVAPKLGVAAPIVLVVVGIGLSYIPGAPEIIVPPEVILSVVLPPILYSAAVNVPLGDFRRNIKAISGLSVLLVIVSAFGSGFLLYWLFPDLQLAAAIALGAVISPPDAVAATAIGKRLGLPPRLVTVLEGEGLVNDATALVMLRSAIAATAGAVTFWGVLGDFVLAVALAIIIGGVIGALTVWFRSKIGDPVLNTAISFAVPFLAFFPAEELHASGVLAVVVAGLITGHASAKYFTAQDRISERINWRTVQLLLENGVFLLMGFELHLIINQVRDEHLGVVQAVLYGLLSTVALVIIRVAFVVPLIALLRRDQRRAEEFGPLMDSTLDRLTSRATEESGRRQKRADRLTRMVARRRSDLAFLTAEGLGWRGGAVLAWSGMRGVVTLAAAQSLPTDLPYRPQLVLIAFTVALVTLVGQGGTLPLVIRRLRVRGSDKAKDREELARLFGEITELGLAPLDNPELRRVDGSSYEPEVVERVRHETRRKAALASERAAADMSGPQVQQHELRLRVLQAERAALLDARASGAYPSRILARAQHLLDQEESRLGTIDGH